MISLRSWTDRRAVLERLYAEYHRPQFLASDPLGIVRRFDAPADREVVALVAASFAFGNVKSINGAVERVLAPHLPHPARSFAAREPREWTRLYRGFSYRWLREEDVRLYGAWIGGALRRHGTLGALWQSLDDSREETVLPTLARWVDALTAMPVGGLRARQRELRRASGAVSALPSGAHLLLTSPRGASACKRMCLFLRWMIRPDDGIDLALWDISPSRLVMPVDTHVLQMARALGLTRRNTADKRTAIEITECLRRIDPGDPIRFDFSMVRPGIMRLQEVIADVRGPARR